MFLNPTYPVSCSFWIGWIQNLNWNPPYPNPKSLNFWRAAQLYNPTLTFSAIEPHCPEPVKPWSLNPLPVSDVSVWNFAWKWKPRLTPSSGRNGSVATQNFLGIGNAAFFKDEILEKVYFHEIFHSTCFIQMRSRIHFFKLFFPVIFIRDGPTLGRGEFILSGHREITYPVKSQELCPTLVIYSFQIWVKKVWDNLKKQSYGLAKNIQVQRNSQK